MDPRFSQAAGELQLWIARLMGADATVQEWIVFEKKCSTWSVGFEELLAEWLRVQSAGSRLPEFAGGKEQMAFVMRHMEGKFI
jgi:hypothetical protein